MSVVEAVSNVVYLAWQSFTDASLAATPCSPERYRSFVKGWLDDHPAEAGLFRLFGVDIVGRRVAIRFSGSTGRSFMDQLECLEFDELGRVKATA